MEIDKKRMVIDPLSQQLGIYLLQKILLFISPEIRFFLKRTCMAWYNILRNERRKLPPALQAIKVAKQGYLSLLECLYVEYGKKIWKMYMDDYATTVTSSLSVLKFAHENGCPWHKWTCVHAAANGSLECLQYAHKNKCPWDELTCVLAAKGGYLDCLEYAHKNKCPWDYRVIECAAQSGHLQCLKYAYENGCRWNGLDAGYCAAKGGKLDCLKYAFEKGCPLDIRICFGAARSGYLECLKYAHELGCPWNNRTFDVAIEFVSCNKNKKTGIIKYLHESRCTWTNSSVVNETYIVDLIDQGF